MLLNTVKYLLAVARQRITNTQKVKNNVKDINVKIGWKNRPGNSFKHFALSLNNAAIKLMRLRNTHERNSKIICNIKNIVIRDRKFCYYFIITYKILIKVCLFLLYYNTYSDNSSDNRKYKKCSFISDSFFKKFIWISFVQSFFNINICHP